MWTISRGLAGDVAIVVAQTGEGLAAGLTSVFAYFAGASRRRVIAFNSDSPHLPASVLEKAFEALATCDMVVGPTYDGGYYLVGAKRTIQGFSWATEWERRTRWRGCCNALAPSVFLCAQRTFFTTSTWLVT